jgi:hypothetical protein
VGCANLDHATRNASPIVNARYHGKPSGKAMLNIGFSYFGDVQLKLDNVYYLIERGVPHE